MSTLNSSINNGITLGTGAYASPLTVTTLGTIAPFAYTGTNGIFGAANGLYLYNQGGIFAGSGVAGTNTSGYLGTGGAGTDGGDAVTLSGSATLSNVGVIIGAAGGAGGSDPYIAGSNTIGGYGGTGGNGGDGIRLTGHGYFTNIFAVVGGAGGAGGTGGVYGQYGYSGGGGLGGSGGVGADLSAVTASNGGYIEGGFGGIGGLSGHYGAIGGGAGGVGVEAMDGLFTNIGHVVGGYGGNGGGNDLGPSVGGTGGQGFAENGGTLLNFGTIEGGDGGHSGVGIGTFGVDRGVQRPAYGGLGNSGVALYGGTLINENQGLIVGGNGGNAGPYESGAGRGGNGVFVSSGIVINAGTILAGNVGKAADGSGDGPGSGGFGIVLRGGMLDGNITTTLVNSGLIESSYGYRPTVYSYGGPVMVILEPGASFVGRVALTTSYANVLEFAAGTTGQAINIGNSFSNFETAEVEIGVAVNLNGIISAPSLINSGAISVLSSDYLVINGAISGTGVIIDDQTLLFLGSSVASGQTVSFTGTGGILELEHPGKFHGRIDGFGQGDLVELLGFAATASSYITGVGLVLSSAGRSETLAIAEPLGGFAVTEQNGNTDIACFCAGTRIATPRGGVAVEQLAIGDLVNTDRGAAPVKWIGRRAYEGAFIAGNHLALPVRIRRHALAFNVPSRDVFISPDHGVCEGGVLVPAWRLLNGVSITQAERVARVEYYHIELKRHALIFAENMPVESFVDADCRQRFRNAEEFERLYPEPSSRQAPCRPRVEDGFLLQRIRDRINARAGMQPPLQGHGPLRGHIDEVSPRLRGWAQDSLAPETPVVLEILHDGAVLGQVLANRYRPDLRKAGLGAGCHAFDIKLPPLPGAVAVRRVSDGALITAPPPPKLPVRHCHAANNRYGVRERN